MSISLSLPLHLRPSVSVSPSLFASVPQCLEELSISVDLSASISTSFCLCASLCLFPSCLSVSRVSLPLLCLCLLDPILPPSATLVSSQILTPPQSFPLDWGAAWEWRKEHRVAIWGKWILSDTVSPVPFSHSHLTAPEVPPTPPSNFRNSWLGGGLPPSLPPFQDLAGSPLTLSCIGLIPTP